MYGNVQFNAISDQCHGSLNSAALNHDQTSNLRRLLTQMCRLNMVIRGIIAGRGNRRYCQLAGAEAYCGGFRTARLFVCLWLCGSVTTITRNCVHRSSPKWVCR